MNKIKFSLSFVLFSLRHSILFLTFVSVCVGLIANEKAGKHLFVLSGQSNMARLNVDEFFTPLVKTSLGKENVIVVKHAIGGARIINWTKDYIGKDGKQSKKDPKIYNQLISDTKTAIKDQKIKDVTFIWMQGESDALVNKKHPTAMPPQIYRKNFYTVLDQLKNDLGVTHVNLVIGRLNDKFKGQPGWDAIRKVQVDMAEELSGIWVDVDDLNTGKITWKGKTFDGVDDMHYTDIGYKIFGERLAKAASKLVKAK